MVVFESQFEYNRLLICVRQGGMSKQDLTHSLNICFSLLAHAFNQINTQTQISEMQLTSEGTQLCFPF